MPDSLTRVMLACQVCSSTFFSFFLTIDAHVYLNQEALIIVRAEETEPCGSTGSRAQRGARYVSWVAYCFSYNVNSSSGSSALGIGVGAAGGGGAGGASLNASSSAPIRPSAPPAIQVTAPTPTEKKQARVLYDYDAADSSELSLLADEVTVVVFFLIPSHAFTA